MTRLCNSARTHRVPFLGLSGTGLPVPLRKTAPLFPKSKNTPAPQRSTLEGQHVRALRNRADLHLGKRRPTARVEGPQLGQERSLRTGWQEHLAKAGETPARDPEAPGRGKPENPSPQHAHPSSRVNPGEVRGADSRIKGEENPWDQEISPGSLGIGMRLEVGVLVGQAGC